jgi:hypothetical protein
MFMASLNQLRQQLGDDAREFYVARRLVRCAPYVAVTKQRCIARRRKVVRRIEGGKIHAIERDRLAAGAVSARAGTVKQMNSAERTLTQRMERSTVLTSGCANPKHTPTRRAI